MKIRLFLSILLGVWLMGASAPRLTNPTGGASGGPYTVRANPGDTLQYKFNALPGSVSTGKWWSASQGWLELTGSAARCQDLRAASDKSVPIGFATFIARTIGNPAGNIFATIEPTGATRGLADCTSANILAANIQDETSSLLIFNIPAGCLKAADASFRLCIDGDATYRASYVTGNTAATGSVNVQVWNMGTNGAPCASWTPTDSSFTYTGGCDRCNGDTLSTCTATANEDLAVSVGTLSSVRLNSGSYADQYVQYLHTAGWSVTGDVYGGTAWYAGTPSGGVYKILDASYTTLTSISNVASFVNRGATYSSQHYAFSSVVAPSFTGLTLYGGGKGIVFQGANYDAKIHHVKTRRIACTSIELNPSQLDYADLSDIDINQTNVGGGGNCVGSVMVGLDIAQNPSDTSTDTGATLSNVRSTVVGTLPAAGSVLGGRTRTAFMGTLLMTGSSFIAIDPGVNHASKTILGFRFQGSGVVNDIDNSYFECRYPNSTTGGCTAFEPSGASGGSLVVRNSRAVSSGGSGPVLDVTLTGNGDTITFRNFIFDPAKFSDASGTHTLSISPTLCSGTAGTGTSLAVTCPGVTAAHKCGCELASVAAGCSLTEAVPTAGVCTVGHQATVCDGAAIRCSPSVLP